MSSEINEATAKQLASFIERAERLAEEMGALKDDEKDLFLEAKSQGFDVGELKRIIKLRRKDPDKLQEAEAIHDTYINALGALVGSPLGDWAREHMKGDGQARLRGTVATSKLMVGQISKAMGLVAAGA